MFKPTHNPILLNIENNGHFYCFHLSLEIFTNLITHLGSTLLYTTHDNRLMIFFKLKKKFHSNENIEWDYMCLELNWIHISLNWVQIHWLKFELNRIEFEFNWKQMGCKLVEKILKICLWMWCWKKKKRDLKKYLFHAFLLKRMG